MDIQRNIEALASAGEALAVSAEAAGLAASVPSCPGWSVHNLLAHVGTVHRWAETIVGERRSGPHVEAPEPPDALIDWYREGHAALVATLSSAPTDVECWS
ncbi:MAG: maleylpyruvate isomerase N-terminal domain-containing protein, partial [Nocardioides sp.]